MKIYDSMIDLIGETPIVRLTKFSESTKGMIYAKLESFNPAGSIKDRVAKNMLIAGIKAGKIKHDTTIIEPTSGNTGIALAAISASLGYKCIIVMPDTMSKERISLLKAYGAEVILTDGTLGMLGSINKAKRLAEEIPNAFIPDQFSNSANPQIHYDTTGPEIWEAMNGEIDYLVSAVGTGGTITGIGHYLKEKNPNIKVIAVEPTESPLLSKGITGNHKIQGIGAGFFPQTLDKMVYDEVITVSAEEAYQTSKELVEKEGILVGISSGAALCAAKSIAAREAEKKIVVIFPDGGEKYLSVSGYLIP